MAIRWIEAARKHSKGNATQVAVLKELGNCADEAGYCYPSVDYLARSTRLHRRAVQTALRALEALGEIVVDQGRVRGGLNLYRVTVGEAEGGASDAPPGGARAAPPPAHVLRPPRACAAPPGRTSCAPPAHVVRPGGARGAPKPSVEPSVNRQTEREARADATPADGEPPELQRLLSLSFPSGSPTAKARAAVVDRAAEALRRGATWPLLGWAVVSTKSRATKPWDRITEAGEAAAGVVARARALFAPPHFEAFCGANLAELWAWIDARPEISGHRRGGTTALGAMLRELDAWRRQSQTWPSARTVRAARTGGAA